MALNQLLDIIKMSQLPRRRLFARVPVTDHISLPAPPPSADCWLKSTHSVTRRLEDVAVVVVVVVIVFGRGYV